jgi:hypothetical protein
MIASREPNPQAEAPDPLTRTALFLALGLLAALLAPFLLHCLAKVPRATPIDYNEGWNAYHTARLMGGGPLYRPVDAWPVTPVNYPPLSFLIFGTVARLTGRLVLTGRLLSLASLVWVCWLTFRTVVQLTASRMAGWLAAAVWLALAVRLAPAEIGSYNEQLLGHAFSAAALCLHARWRDELGSRRRLFWLALFCCLGLFVKQLLLAVPIALAVGLLLESRRRGLGFVAASLAILAVFAGATRLLGGESVVANLLAFDRQMDAAQRMGELRDLFVGRGALVLLLPAAALLAVSGKRFTALHAYFAVSLALGGYAAGGVGIDRNAWLDFFLATALVIGTLVGTAGTLQAPWRRRLALLGILAGIVPLAARYPAELGAALDQGRLEREEQAYRADVELLRSVPGPALFEELLLGFDAGKEFLFDPFSGSQMILSGRLPESLLTDRLRRKEFAAVVLTSRDVEESRRRLLRTGRHSPDGPPQRMGWWTRGTLEAVRDHYALHAPDRRRYAFFYFPSP